MIAQRGDGGELVVLGTGQRESRGVKRGYIADAIATEAAVREAVTAISGRVQGTVGIVVPVARRSELDLCLGVGVGVVTARRYCPSAW